MWRPIAKKLGYGLHASISRNRWLSELYLNAAGRLCRRLRDRPWKHFVLNSIYSVPWPAMQLKQVTTHFPAGELEAVLFPNLDDLGFQAHLYRRLPYESEVFQWLTSRSYRTIVEIGANVGVFSLFLAKRFPQAAVYSFEPSRKVFSRLLANVAANDCPNLSVFNCAISSESGFLNFFEPAGHLTNGSLHASFASIFSPQVATTSVPVLAGCLIEPLFAQPPFLVKLDVEGAEPEVLQSLQGLIGRHRPDLLIEALPTTEAALNDLAFLRDGSYHLFNIQPRGLVEQERFIAGQYRDYAVLPANSPVAH